MGNFWWCKFHIIDLKAFRINFRIFNFHTFEEWDYARNQWSRTCRPRPFSPRGTACNIVSFVGGRSASKPWQSSCTESLVPDLHDSPSYSIESGIYDTTRSKVTHTIKFHMFKFSFSYTNDIQNIQKFAPYKNFPLYDTSLNMHTQLSRSSLHSIASMVEICKPARLV